MYTINKNLFKGLWKTSSFQFSQLKPKKDYYAILGLNNSASMDDIKKAYRALAKKYHPDVSSKTNKSADALLALEKFRDVAEAYAVLSNTLSRNRYDTTYSPDPSAVYNSTKMKNMSESAKERDNSGNYTSTEKYQPGSYADFKMENLKKYQKEFNLDHLGNYKGGVPKYNKGSVRGNSIGQPGAPHETYLHNENYADNYMIKPVENHFVEEHRHFNNLRKEINTKFRPYFNIEKLEDGQQFFEVNEENRNLVRYPLLGFTLIFLYVLYKKFNQKVKYFEYNAYIKGLMPYEYESFGPLLLEADSFKFGNDKYFTKQQQIKWIENNSRNFA